MHCTQHRSSRPRPLSAPRACAAPPPSLTLPRVKELAASSGLELKIDPLGVFMKADLFREGSLTAFVTAVILPQGRLHIESYKAKPRTGGGLLSVSPGMLVFMAALAFGVQKDCKEVYGLAIKDSPAQHNRLRRYLKRFGGEEVKHVGGSMHDIPNKLLYGGEGVIIRSDIAPMVERAVRMLERAEAGGGVAVAAPRNEGGAPPRGRL